MVSSCCIASVTRSGTFRQSVVVGEREVLQDVLETWRSCEQGGDVVIVGVELVVEGVVYAGVMKNDWISREDAPGPRQLTRCHPIVKGEPARVDSCVNVDEL
eukprot:5039044-Amphidinium_carterae.1